MQWFKHILLDSCCVSSKESSMRYSNFIGPFAEFWFWCFSVRNTSHPDFLIGIAEELLLDSRLLGSVGLGSQPLGCGRRHVDFFSGLA